MIPFVFTGFPFRVPLAARTCGQPADPENGWHKASCYTYTCRATYECAKEYELVGRAERTCQADGTWSPKDLPTCVRKWRSEGADSAGSAKGRAGGVDEGGPDVPDLLVAATTAA